MKATSFAKERYNVWKKKIKIFFLRTTGPFQRSILGWREFKCVQMKGIQMYSSVGQSYDLIEINTSDNQN